VDKGGVTPTLPKHASVSKSRINCVPETLAPSIIPTRTFGGRGFISDEESGEARLAVRKNFLFCLLHRLHFFGRFAALIALTIFDRIFIDRVVGFFTISITNGSGFGSKSGSHFYHGPPR
jgi:hypothetical protein